MRSVQVSKANGPFEIVDKDTPGLALDKFVSRYKHAAYAIVIPLLKKAYSQASDIQGFPGHEVAGVIDEVGKEVSQWRPKQRVGISTKHLRLNQKITK